MDLGLRRKVAVVTGASRGIGRGIARRLAEEGMSVAVAARDEGKLKELAGEIEGGGGKVMVFAGDLSKEEVPGELAGAVVKRFGRMDLVVNNAGATKRGDFLVLSEEDWAEGFALKFFGAVRLCRAAWGELVKTGGSIVNIAGVGGTTGSAEFAIGGAVNAALMNLTKVLADRGVKEGVRVNVINPGSIVTDRLTVRVKKLAGELGVTEEEAARRMAAGQGIARFGTAEEIADVVAFLASGRAGYVQGAVVGVDGGMTRTM